MNLPTTKLNMSSLVAGGVVVTVAVVITSIFAVKGLVGQLSQNNQVLSKKRVASSTLSDNLEALEKLSQQYDALGDKKKLINDALPTTANFPAIVSMMENLSKNAGVKLLSLAPSTAGAEAVAKGPTSYEFTANISGGYSSFKEFLRNIEFSLRPMAITGMKISGSTELLGIDMTIGTYFQKEYDTTLKTEPLKKSSASSSSSSSATSPSSKLNPSQGVSQ